VCIGNGYVDGSSAVQYTGEASLYGLIVLSIVPTSQPSVAPVPLSLISASGSTAVISVKIELYSNEQACISYESRGYISAVSVVMYFSGSGTGRAQDMEISVTDPQNNCILIGMQGSPTCGFGFRWPESWNSNAQDLYTSSVDVSVVGAGGHGIYTLCVRNSDYYGTVRYKGSITLGAPTACQVIPTFEPTQEPSQEPTAEPSYEPTHEPTQSPVPEPTMLPKKPTPEPTHAPTDEPTVEPTHAPTVYPTVEPTHLPSAHPTHEPTAYPVAHPTHAPTVKPSVHGAPTLRPTRSTVYLRDIRPKDKFLLNSMALQITGSTYKPSMQPTKEPTHKPTKKPTVEPTFKPSRKPTTEPTVPWPTAGPSLANSVLRIAFNTTQIIGNYDSNADKYLDSSKTAFILTVSKESNLNDVALITLNTMTAKSSTLKTTFFYGIQIDIGVGNKYNTAQEAYDAVTQALVASVANLKFETALREYAAQEGSTLLA